MVNETHVSPETLLMAVDGELPAKEQARVEAHLAACWMCRGRKQELEGAISRFVDFHRESCDASIPAHEGPRALLAARLREAETQKGGVHVWQNLWRLLFQREGLAMAGCALLVMALGLLWQTQHRARATRATATTIASSLLMPDPTLTPGATVVLDRVEVCRETGANNRRVPLDLQRKVFAEYGLSAAHPEAYEVDYLITPALGGADDIHNLWPESNQKAEWNALVKDALEERLRDLVCEGRVDLATAQHEIASNWIEAYKKYFQTERPLPNIR